ncbi:MAG: hypothetical protein ACXWB4_06550 [Kaistella sp.]
MFRTVKIFLIILGLGVFILPTQTLFAQDAEMECCEKKPMKEDCCNTEQTEPCHSGDSSEHSDKNGCGNDCSNCHSCSVNFVLNYDIIEESQPLMDGFFAHQLKFNYEISFFSSSFHNIWQPPKIA